MEIELLILDKLHTPVRVSAFGVFAFQCYTFVLVHLHPRENLTRQIQGHAYTGISILRNSCCESNT